MARVWTAGIQSALFHRITMLSIRWCQSCLWARVCRMAQKDLPWGEGRPSMSFDTVGLAKKPYLHMLFNIVGLAVLSQVAKSRRQEFHMNWHGADGLEAWDISLLRDGFRGGPRSQQPHNGVLTEARHGR